MIIISNLPVKFTNNDFPEILFDWPEILYRRSPSSCTELYLILQLSSNNPLSNSGSRSSMAVSAYRLIILCPALRAVSLTYSDSSANAWKKTHALQIFSQQCVCNLYTYKCISFSSIRTTSIFNCYYIMQILFFYLQNWWNNWSNILQEILFKNDR